MTQRPQFANSCLKEWQEQILGGKVSGFWHHAIAMNTVEVEFKIALCQAYYSKFENTFLVVWP
jgi:hypothetical protein